MSTLATTWVSQFYGTLEGDREEAGRLRDAAVNLNLKAWTASLTSVVVRSFEALGYLTAAKAYRCEALPVCRNEYLGQDVMVFSPTQTGWRFPVAVCELENSRRDDLVAYALWKVLCIRSALRVVFCYRPEPGDAPPLVSTLASGVLAGVPSGDREAIGGETVLFVGSRNEAGTFPYGFFHGWKLNLNTGKFDRFQRPERTEAKQWR